MTQDLPPLPEPMHFSEEFGDCFGSGQMRSYAEASRAPLLREVEELRAKAARWDWVAQFLSIDDVGDEHAVYGLVIDSEGMEEAAQRARCWGAFDYFNDEPTVDDAIDAALSQGKGEGE